MLAAAGGAVLGLASVSSPGPGQGVTGDHLQGLAASDRGEADTGGGRSEGGAVCGVLAVRLPGRLLLP